VIEEHVRASGLPFTILRPTSFMELLLSPFVRSRQLGFSLKQIDTFARAAGTGASVGPCRAIMLARLADVRARLKQLRAVESRLAELLREGEHAADGESCERLVVLRG